MPVWARFSDDDENEKVSAYLQDRSAFIMRHAKWFDMCSNRIGSWHGWASLNKKVLGYHDEN